MGEEGVETRVSEGGGCERNGKREGVESWGTGVWRGRREGGGERRKEGKGGRGWEDWRGVGEVSELRWECEIRDVWGIEWEVREGED